MTEKRYYYKDYEEAYYIFDSKTLSKNEFEEKVEYYGYNVFADSLTGEEVVDLLNSLTDENKQLKEDNDYLEKRFKEEEWHYDHIDEDRDVWKHKCQELERENEELKKQREELFYCERDTKNEWRTLKKENEELKEKIDKLEGMLINNGLM